MPSPRWPAMHLPDYLIPRASACAGLYDINKGSKCVGLETDSVMLMDRLMVSVSLMTAVVPPVSL